MKGVVRLKIVFQYHVQGFFTVGAYSVYLFTTSENKFTGMLKPFPVYSNLIQKSGAFS